MASCCQGGWLWCAVYDGMDGGRMVFGLHSKISMLYGHGVMVLGTLKGMGTMRGAPCPTLQFAENVHLHRQTVSCNCPSQAVLTCL